MKRFILPLFSGRKGKEQQPISISSFTPDTDVEALTTNKTLLLTRQLMTLSRRRRCAINHMDVDNPFDHQTLDWEIIRWYLNNEYTQENITQALQSDLIAILENPTEISLTLQKRIIFTDYFSPGQLVDYYNYGNIHPFTFKTKETTVNFRDTLFDRISFPERVATVISFDSEIRGHKHQIRYFRSLLATYSLAHLIDQKTTDSKTQQAVDLLLQDELTLAKGWITTKNHADNLGIDFMNLPPDKNLLYSQDKVYESAFLLTSYSDHSKRLFAN